MTTVNEVKHYLRRFALFGTISTIKGTLMQFENLPTCSYSYKNNTLKISHS